MGYLSSAEAIARLQRVNDQDFSKEQLDILNKADGMCIIASAGSGKTTVLTNLIAKRILTGELDPSKAVCTTFSADGADEMNKRLELLLEKVGASWAIKYTKIKTIHALCKEILDEMGVNTKIITGLDKYKLIAHAVKSSGEKMDAEDIRTVESLLGYQMNKMLIDKEVVLSPNFSLDIDEKTFCTIRQLYAASKNAMGVIDFEDLLYKVYHIFYRANRPDILNYFRNKWQYFYIDEAQDMSKIQYEIMKALMLNPDTIESDSKRIMMIGDDDQCIYTWRGAEPEVLLNICGEAEVSKMHLSTNYRCKSTIVDFSAVGIVNNLIREEKQIKANESGGTIDIVDLPYNNLYENVMATADIVEEKVKEKEELEQICVLTRFNQDLGLLDAELFRRGICSNIPKEAKLIYGKVYEDLVGILDLVSNNCWFLSSSSISINGWKLFKYLNKNTARLMGNIMSGTGLSITELMNEIVDNYNENIGLSRLNNIQKTQIGSIVTGMSGDTLSCIKQLRGILTSRDTNDKKAELIMSMYLDLNDWRFKGNREQRYVHGIWKWVSMLIHTLGYNEALGMLKTIEQYEKGELASLGGKVILSTCHRAKGREWKYVILMCNDNDTFPSRDTINVSLNKGVTLDDLEIWLEEERRLHYVAKTRAKEKLYLVGNLNDLSYFTRECMGENFGSPRRILNMAIGNIDDDKGELIRALSKIKAGEEHGRKIYRYQ